MSICTLEVALLSELDTEADADLAFIALIATCVAVAAALTILGIRSIFGTRNAETGAEESS